MEWKLANLFGRRKGIGRWLATTGLYRYFLYIVAKAFESLVQCQLYKHLQDNSLLHPAQSGFRSFHSIEDVLLKSVNDWRYALDRDELVAAVFIDQSFRYH